MYHFTYHLILIQKIDRKLQILNQNHNDQQYQQTHKCSRTAYSYGSWTAFMKSYDRRFSPYANCMGQGRNISNTNEPKQKKNETLWNVIILIWDQNMNDFPYVAFGHWPLDICPIQFFSVSFVLCNVNSDSGKIVHDKLTLSFNHEIEWISTSVWFMSTEMCTVHWWRLFSIYFIDAMPYLYGIWCVVIKSSKQETKN